MTRNKKKKYNKIVTLAKSKLNIIETLVSQALRDLKISHKELLMKKESMKQDIWIMKSNDELNKKRRRKN